MRAKVKISVLSTGQEFLLLVAKMNLKGILVFSPQIIPPSSELLLELKLGKENPILLKGFVHKVSDDDSSKKGMVIAFLNPSAETKVSIQAFIEKSQGSGKSEPKPRASTAPKKSRPKKKKSRPKKNIGGMEVTRKPKKAEATELVDADGEVIQPEKTVIVDNTLPALSLQSPDNSQEMMVSTKDEENVHHAGQVLGGETRHVQIHETLTRRINTKKPFASTVYRALGVVLVIVGVILFFRHGVGWIDKQFGIKLVPTQISSQNASPQQLPNITPQVPNNNGVVSSNGSLDTISIDDQGDFLKVTLLGDGNYGDFSVEKLKDPYRIVFTFNSIGKINLDLPKEINNIPVKSIDAKIIGGKVVLSMFMVRDEFMEFDAKPFPHAMDVFFYRE